MLSLSTVFAGTADVVEPLIDISALANWDLSSVADSSDSARAPPHLPMVARPSLPKEMPVLAIHCASRPYLLVHTVANNI